MTKYINVSLESAEPDYLLKLNLHLVAGFLYHKKLQASQNGIVIDYNILSYNLECKVPEYTLVELFGILIDNAIEATPKDGTVHITIDSANGKIIFSNKKMLSRLTQQHLFIYPITNNFLIYLYIPA